MKTHLLLSILLSLFFFQENALFSQCCNPAPCDTLICGSIVETINACNQSPQKLMANFVTPDEGMLIVYASDNDHQSSCFSGNSWNTGILVKYSSNSGTIAGFDPDITPFITIPCFQAGDSLEIWASILQGVTGHATFDLEWYFIKTTDYDDAEPNASIPNAIPLIEDSTHFGHIGYGFIYPQSQIGDRYDYYKFTPQRGGDVVVEIEATNGIGLNNLNQNGHIQSVEVINQAGTIYNNTAFQCIDSGETVVIILERRGLAGCANYSIKCSMGNQFTYPSDREPNQSPNDIETIAFCEEYTGNLNPRTDGLDIYRIVPPAVGLLDIDIEIADRLEANFILTHTTGSAPAFTSTGGSGSKSLQYTLDPNQHSMYYLKVQRSGAHPECGSYVFRARFSTDTICNDWRLKINVDDDQVQRGRFARIWSKQDPDRTIGFTKRIINGIAYFTEQDLDSIPFQGIQELYILDELGEPIGKSSLRYDKQDLDLDRRKEVFVRVHSSLVSYQHHPVEKGLEDWRYPNFIAYHSEDFKTAGTGEPVQGELYPTTLLIPPTDFQDIASTGQIDTSRQPILFVCGYTGTDNHYWGNESDSLDGTYPARLSKLGNGAYDVWQFYYPSDASWKDAGYLLGREVKKLYGMYQKPISIIAHSMGGLVTRSYIEEKATHYSWQEVPLPPLSFGNEIDKVIFLGTPHHGSFAANQLFGEIYPGNLVPKIKEKFDPNAPAARDLGLATPYIMNLNSEGLLNNPNVEYLCLAGTSYKGTTNFFLNSLYPESQHHHDGIVSISSANLLEFGIPLGLLPQFSHLSLSGPDEEVLSNTEKEILPRIFHDFITNLSLSSGSLQTLAFGKLLTEADLSSLPLSQFMGENQVDFQVGIPVVQFIDPDSQLISFERNSRFKINYGGIGKLSLIRPSRLNAFSYESSGVYLYDGLNNFASSNDVNKNRLRETFDDKPVGFYGYSKNKRIVFDPLNLGGFVNHSGVGWKYWSSPDTQWAVEMGFVAGILPFPWKYAKPHGTIKWQRSTTQYSTLMLGSHATRITLSNQFVDPLSLGNFDPLQYGKRDLLDTAFIWVDCFTEEVSFVLDYGNNAAPNFSIMKPDGQIVDASLANDSTVFYTHYPDLHTQYFTIVEPVVGRWLALIDNQPAIPDSSYHLAFPMKVQNSLSLQVDTTTIQNEVMLYASLSDSSFTTQDLSMEGFWSDDSANVFAFNLFDDGQGVDSLANDGVFSTTLQFPQGGDYNLLLSMFGMMDSCIFIRQLSSLVSFEEVVNTSIEEKKSNGFNIRIYPNPANDHLMIDLNDYPVSVNTSVQIYNSMGQKVKDHRLLGTHSTLRLSDLGAAGIYIVNIIDEGMRIKSMRLLYSPH